MASLFWVGGAATWDGTAGSKWASTSGGAGGQPIPTAAEDVFFDAASGAVTVTVSSARLAKTFTTTGFTGTIAGASTPTITVSGSVVIGAGTTVSASGPALIFDTAASTLTSNGVGLRSITINGASASLTLLDALSIPTSGQILTLTQGTFDANDFAVSVPSFSSSNSNTRVLSMGNGTWTLTNSGTANIWSMGTVTGLTFNKEGSSIVMTPSAAMTGALSFNGGSQTFNGISISANASKFPFVFNAARFSTFAVTLPNSIEITAATTTTIDTAPTISGSSAARLLLTTTAKGAVGTLSVPSGAMSIDNAFIADIAFTGGATFTATSSYDLLGNSGITITEPSGGAGMVVHPGMSGGML